MTLRGMKHHSLLWAGLLLIEVVLFLGPSGSLASDNSPTPLVEEVARVRAILQKMERELREKCDQLHRLEQQLAAAEKTQSAEVEKTLARRLGVRLEVVTGDLIARNHPMLRGGLRVLRIHSEGLAAQAGIKQGDILVGLHQWEMLSLDNVLYVLNHPDRESLSPLRFYILRNGQVHRGLLQPIQSNPAEPASQNQPGRPMQAIILREPISSPLPPPSPKVDKAGKEVAQGVPDAPRCPSCVVVGQKLENMTLTSLDGTPWEFKRHRRGQLTLLNFWSTSCGPCVRAIPHLCDLQGQFGPHGLEVIGIAYEAGSFPEQAQKARSARGRLVMNYPTLLGGGSEGACPVKKELQVSFLPTLILLNANGTIIWRSGQEGLTAEKLRELKQEISTRLLPQAPPQVEQPRENKIASLMKQFQVFYKEGRYEEAESLARKAHELDPENETVAAAASIASKQRRLRESTTPGGAQRRIEELERRIQELEKQVRDLKKS